MYFVSFCCSEVSCVMNNAMAHDAKKASNLYIPTQRKTPTGVINRIPVLTSQVLFRGATPTQLNAFYDEPSGLPSLQQVMSPVRFENGVGESLLRFDSTAQSKLAIAAGAASSIAKQMQKRSSIAEAGNKALKKLAAEITEFINNETGILATQNDGSAADMGPQRLAVYKAAFRMALPAVPAPLQAHFEAVMNEYDMFVHSIEQVAQDHTRLRERQRLENHFAQHFVEEARIKEAALEKRKQNFESVEASMKLKLTNLEKQLAALQSENRSLRSQQNEDTERYSSMAQSVIESRLAASKAELALLEMKEIYEKVRMVERNNIDIMYDFGRMLRLLRLNKIMYDPRCQSMVDALVREGGF